MQLTLCMSACEHIQGSTDASITLLKYGDYQCPRCQQAHQIIKALQRSQSSDCTTLEARWRFVFRHFPLATIHAHAQYAAEVAEAAGAQGQFWQMHDYLFEHPQTLGNHALLQYAAQLGLDVDRFEREVAEHVYAKRVRYSFISGIRNGVNGTPTFFINARRYDGDWSIRGLAEAIQQAEQSD